jgi:hypothetical protein
MATAVWPSNLPQFVLEQGFSEALADAKVETKMEAGPPKARPRYTAGFRTYTATIMCTAAQKEAFDVFYEDTLAFGSLPFTWVEPISQSLATMQFLNPPPKWSVRGGAHMASFAMRRVKRDTAVSTGTFPVVGFANGAGSATATSRTIRPRAGTATAVGSAAAVGRRIVAASGVATGSGLAQAVTGATTGLTAPVYTNTAAAGAPLEGTVTMGSDIYEGFELQIQRSTTGAKNPDGSYTSPTMDILHEVTPSECAALRITNAALIPDGYTETAGTWYQQCRWVRADGQMSPWSNELTGTVVTSVAELATTNGADKSQYVSVTGTPKLIFEGTSNLGTNVCIGVRTTTEAQNDLFHFEVEVLAFRTDASPGSIFVGITDASEPLGPTGSTPKPGGSAGVPGCAYRHDYASTGLIYRNGGTLSAGGSATAVGDFLIVEGNRTTNTVVFKRRRAGVTTTLATVTMTSEIPADWHAFVGCARNLDKGEVNFGATPFEDTPTAGYDIYG